MNHLIEIRVINGKPVPRPLSKPHVSKSKNDTVQWDCTWQFYLTFALSPFDPNDPIVRSIQVEPGRWTAGPLPLHTDTSPDRYEYEPLVLWANPNRENKIEPIRLNSPDIIVEL